jgi:hypothetical protein
VVVPLTIPSPFFRRPGLTPTETTQTLAFGLVNQNTTITYEVRGTKHAVVLRSTCRSIQPLHPGRAQHWQDAGTTTYYPYYSVRTYVQVYAQEEDGSSYVRTSTYCVVRIDTFFVLSSRRASMLQHSDARTKGQLYLHKINASGMKYCLSLSAYTALDTYVRIPQILYPYLRSNTRTSGIDLYQCSEPLIRNEPSYWIVQAQPDISLLSPKLDVFSGFASLQYEALASYVLRSTTYERT